MTPLQSTLNHIALLEQTSLAKRFSLWAAFHPNATFSRLNPDGTISNRWIIWSRGWRDG